MIKPGDVLATWRSLWRIAFTRETLNPIFDYTVSPPYSFVHIPDIFLYANRIVCIDDMYRSPFHKELERRGLLHIPSRGILNDDDVHGAFDLLTSILSKSRKWQVLQEIQRPFLSDCELTCYLSSWLELEKEEAKAFIQKIKNLDKQASKIRELDVNHLRGESEGEKMQIYKRFLWGLNGLLTTPITINLATGFPAVTEEYAKPTSILVQSLLKTTSIDALEIVNSRLLNFGNEYLQELAEKWRVLKDLTLFLPPSLLLVLRELRDNSKPSDFFDTLLSLRKQRTIRQFRKWLIKLDQARKEGNMEELAKAEAKLMRAAKNVQAEWEKMETEQISKLSFVPSLLVKAWKTLKGAYEPSDLATSIAEKIIKISPNLAERLGLDIQVFHLQRLVNASLSFSDVRQELHRCFGEQGKLLANWIIYWNAIESKSMEISALS